MDVVTEYEIMAEAFRIMTGHMAPGKDVSPLAYGAPLEERQAEWEKWNEAHGKCVRAMLMAVDRVVDWGDK